MERRGMFAALAIVALGASPAWPADGQLAHHKANGTQVFAELKGDRLLLRSLGPPTVFVRYDIDVDGDRRIDPTVDVSYEVRIDGTLCAAKWISETESASCGQVRTAARASHEAMGALTMRRVDVPVSELTRNGRSVLLRLGMTEQGKGTAHAWLSYDLASGAATGLPASAPPAAASARAVAAGSTVSSAPAGLSERELTDRYDAGKEGLSQQCKYRHLPQIRLMNSPIDGAYGRFETRPQESASLYNNELVFRSYRDGRRRALIVVSDDRHTQARIASAELLVGASAFALKPKHPSKPSNTSVTYERYVSFETLPGPVMTALLQATSARLQLRSEQGLVSQWTFPVGNLRYLQPAMEKSGWKCGSAW